MAPKTRLWPYSSSGKTPLTADGLCVCICVLVGGVCGARELAAIQPGDDGGLDSGGLGELRDGWILRVWEAAWAGLGGRLDVGVQQEGGNKCLAWDPGWLMGLFSEVGEEADGEAMNSALDPT